MQGNDSDEADSPALSPSASPNLIRRSDDQPVSDIGKFLMQKSRNGPGIFITNAEKLTEFGQSFFAYTIEVESTPRVVLKRRYSEFESIRKILCRLYPFVVVPPIPEKHSISDYALKPGKAKDDPKIIEVRKRMLQSFLNRVASHELLVKEPLFHKFLENIPWIGKTDKSVKSPVSSSVIPLALKKLQNPDLKFLELEAYADKLHERISFWHKNSRRLVKVLTEYSSIDAELGAVLNSFSLHETRNASLAKSVEAVGQVLDNSHLHLQSLIRDLEEAYIDQIHEYDQLAGMVQHILRTRHQHNLDYEDLGDQLDSKRIYLSNLEKDPSAAPAAANANPLSGLGKMMIGLGDKIHNLMDSDPELTRRSQAAKCRDQITKLEASRELAHETLTKFSDQVQKDLERFNRRKSEDFVKILLAMARIHKTWLEKSLETWREARRSVDGIRI